MREIPSAEELNPMPFAEDSEKALLCSIALRPSIIDECDFSQLFYLTANWLIYQHFALVYSDRAALDFVLVKESFNDSELAGIGGIDYLNHIYGFVPTSENWRHYRETLVDRHARRTTIDACNQLKEKMYDVEADLKSPIREIAEKALLAMITKSQEITEIYLDEAVADEVDNLISEEAPAYIEASGIRALDLALGGLLPGDQVVIAAETSFGKTTLAINIAAHAALGPQRKKVAIFSFEMSLADIRKRIMACCAEVPLKALRYKNVTPEELKKIDLWRATIPRKQRSIVLQEGYSLDITEIVSRCRRLKATGDLDMVVVDYLQLVNPAISRESNRQREIADISRRLKVMAEELGVVVIALSQLNDSGQLRESRAIGQDADVILFIDEGKSDDAFERTVRIGKSRNGPSGAKVPVHFYGDYVKFCDKT